METTPTKTARNNRILELRDSGLSWNRIAFQLKDEGFGEISPQRIGKIIAQRDKIPSEMKD